MRVLGSILAELIDLSNAMSKKEMSRHLSAIIKIMNKFDIAEILDHNVALLKNQTGIMQDLKALKHRIARIEKSLDIENDATNEISSCPITMNMDELKKRLVELEIEKPFIAPLKGPSTSSSCETRFAIPSTPAPKRKSMTPAQDRLKKPRS